MVAVRLQWRWMTTLYQRFRSKRVAMLLDHVIDCVILDPQLKNACIRPWPVFIPSQPETHTCNLLMDRPTPSLRKLPFVCEDPTMLWRECVAFAWHYHTKLNSCDNRRIRKAFESYSKQRALNLVWHSNQLEGTLPHGISQRQTYKVLESLYTTYLNQTEEVSVWPKVIVDWSESESDAEKDRLGKCQLAQHRSFLSLPQGSQTKTPLTERLIKDRRS